ncbi:MAG: DUF2791 family P-loop domain-containing protein [Tannerella sp.]|jgi:hypothetical protein|nr:DUF2791 family P-loop domain-containing protein [Tannerella sp.]
MLNIKPKEATAIINSLTSGVVPKIGVQHITVGRSKEIEATLAALEDVKNGHSMMKFWIGDFGSGKSFMLYLLNTLAMQQKFVVAQADFTPHIRLYSNDGKGQALYAALMNNLSIQTKPEGGALPVLLEKWLESILFSVAQQHQISIAEIRQEQYNTLIHNEIMQSLNKISDSGALDFATVIIRYYEGFLKNDDELKKNALKWLRGEYTAKMEARKDLGVSDIINDRNYYDMLKSLCRLFVNIGYSGLVINLDEAVNLYNIVNNGMRQRNYEKLLSIYNDCYQGKTGHLFFNIAATIDVLEDAAKGFYSYEALKTRLKVNIFESDTLRDYSQPVIRLIPLNHSEIFVLLQNLKQIFDFNYQTDIRFTDADIQRFMEEIYNKPLADEFLTPREVIRDFLSILNILHQNPAANLPDLLKEISISAERENISPENSAEKLREMKLKQVQKLTKNQIFSGEILEELAGILLENENVHKMVSSSFKNEAGNIIVTDNRLIFIGKKGNITYFPYPQINDMTFTSGNRFSTLSMDFDGGKVKFDYIPKNQTKPLINILNAQIEIFERKTLAAELKYWEKEISNSEMKGMLNKMSRIADMIQEKDEKDGELFFLRHADTLAKLLNQYKTLEISGIDSPEITASKTQILHTISLTNSAFEQELKNRLQTDILDVDAESEAYLNRLKIKGLLN